MIETEPHFTPQEIAELWKVSPDTVIRLFDGQPGVLVLGTTERGRKRGKRMLRIPRTVLERVHRDRMVR